MWTEINPKKSNRNWSDKVHIWIQNYNIWKFIFDKNRFWMFMTIDFPRPFLIYDLVCNVFLFVNFIFLWTLVSIKLYV